MYYHIFLLKCRRYPQWGKSNKGLVKGHAMVILSEKLAKGGMSIAFVRRQTMQFCDTTNETVEFIDEA